MNFEQILTTAYADTTQRTLQQWCESPTAGRAHPGPYQKSLFGITTGNVFELTDWLAELHKNLIAYTQADPRLDVVPQNSMHFTFLALATSLFENMNDIPKEVEALIPLYETYVRPVMFCIHHVRLLPLGNALLLAGIPNEESFEARQCFAQAVLNSAWAPWLKDRYKNHSIPPLFWHTTLARYDAEFLSEPIRALYDRYSTEILPIIKIGRPLLAATTYNWSCILEL